MLEALLKRVDGLEKRLRDEKKSDSPDEASTSKDPNEAQGSSSDEFAPRPAEAAAMLLPVESR